MKTSLFLAGSTVFVAAAAFVQIGPVTVSLDGKAFSSRGRVIGGQLYVPAADVAKAFSLKLGFKAGQTKATLTTAGGEDPAKGASGKANELLFNGRTRLMLSSKTETTDMGTVYTLEVRNAEKKTKQYYFGFSEHTQLLLLDDGGQEVRGALQDRNKDYAVNVQPATAYRVKWVFATPTGFEAKRMVIRLNTQISGQPATDEVFRVELGTAPESPR